MKLLVSFDESLIAPCGMNCGTCIAYLRVKNTCPGCRVYSDDKAVSVRRCIIIKCENLAGTTNHNRKIKGRLKTSNNIIPT